MSSLPPQPRLADGRSSEPRSSDRRSPDRRRFLRATTAAALTLTADQYARVLGANSRLGVAFIGCGARAQAHIHVINRLAPTQNLRVVAVCDVWDGHADEYEHTFNGTTTRRRYSQGLYPSARLCGLNPNDRLAVTKDYRRVVERPDVDIVCISTPDHWHGRQTLDALAAGKDVYVERPMTRTRAEAEAVVAAAAAQQRVLTVGVQSLTDPSLAAASAALARGDIGPVVQMQAGAFRNDSRGQWRFYRVLDTMTPQTIDWNLFLGHRFEVAGVKLGPTPEQFPFQREHFAQWRCYSPFSLGPISDLLTGPATRLLAITGVREPRRVVAAGGLFHEHDGRDVPDLCTIVADFVTDSTPYVPGDSNGRPMSRPTAASTTPPATHSPTEMVSELVTHPLTHTGRRGASQHGSAHDGPSGCQLLLTATTLSNYPIEELIRGRRGVLKFVRGAMQILADDPTRTSTFPARLEGPIEPTAILTTGVTKQETEAHWLNFLDCVRRRDRQTLCPPELGAAVVSVLTGGAAAVVPAR